MYLEYCSQLAIINVIATNVVEFLRELNKGQWGRQFRIKVEAHSLLGRCWVIAVHVTVQYQYVRGVTEYARDSKLRQCHKFLYFISISPHKLRKQRDEARGIEKYKTIQSSSFEMVWMRWSFLARNIHKKRHLNLVSPHFIIRFINYHLEKWKEKDPKLFHSYGTESIMSQCK